MNDLTLSVVKEFKERYNFISCLEDDIMKAFYVINECFNNGGKLLVCGNGGSAADADHIVGELLKGFRKKRKLSDKEIIRYLDYGDEGKRLALSLQGSLPAINLSAHTALITAVINDISSDVIFSQQILGYGNVNDVLLGISTSGNSKNVLYAAITANTKNMKTIALTGEKGGKMAKFFDVSIKAPSLLTDDIQNMHSAIYHLLCAMLEAERWEE